MKLFDEYIKSGILPPVADIPLINRLNIRDAKYAHSLKDSTIKAKPKRDFISTNYTSSAELQKMTAKVDAYNDCDSTFAFLILPANEMAQLYINDCIHVIKTNTDLASIPIVKEKLNLIQYDMRKYDRAFVKRCKESRAGNTINYMYDYLGAFQDECHDIFELLKASADSIVQKLGYDPKVTVPLVMASSLLHFACDVWKNFWTDAKVRWGFDFEDKFKAWDMHFIERQWCYIESAVSPKNDILLMEDKTFVGWFNKYADILYSPEMINKIGMKAFSYNPGLKEKADDMSIKDACQKRKINKLITELKAKERKL